MDYEPISVALKFGFLAVLLLVVLPAVSLICQTGGFPKPPVLFQSPLSPRIANYDMAVTLEPEQRMLRGRQVISWRNDSPNRKRFARSNPREGTALRFGFDLTPLFDRLAEIALGALRKIKPELDR